MWWAFEVFMFLENLYTDKRETKATLLEKTPR